jgi:hypothetical protein
MFDNISMYGPTPQKIEINEYRAPTDQSISIYNELREKAINDIVDCGASQFGADEIYWVVFDNQAIQGITFELSMTINGRKIRDSLNIRRINILCRTEEYVLKEISSIISNFIIQVISKEVMTDLIRVNAGTIANLLSKK